MLGYGFDVYKQVLDPLGMTGSGTRSYLENHFPPFDLVRAHGTAKNAAGSLLFGEPTPTPNLPVEDGAGGMWSNANDMLKFMRYSMGLGTTGGALLGAHHLLYEDTAHLRSVGKLNATTREHVGLGWQIITHKLNSGKTVSCVHKGGDLDGFNAEVMFRSEPGAAGRGRPAQRRPGRSARHRGQDPQRTAEAGGRVEGSGPLSELDRGHRKPQLSHVHARQPPTLFLIVGLPGAGKTVRARGLAAERGALLMTPDAWMISLFGQTQPEGKRDLLEGRLIGLAIEALRLRVSVVLDFGLWGRDERSALRWIAASVGAACEVIYLPVDREVQLRRVQGRWERTPEQTFPMTEADLEAWRSRFDVPDADELSNASLPSPPPADGSWFDWAARRWPSLRQSVDPVSASAVQKFGSGPGSFR